MSRGLYNCGMKHWQAIFYAFAAKPWHLIVFAMVGFLSFFYAGTRHDAPKR